MIYKTDYHIHTCYSDGSDWPEAYLPAALKAGLSEIGFSDHLTLMDDQKDWSIDPSLLEEYCNRILRLRETTRDVIIRIGLEVDYFPGKEDLIDKTIKDLPLDYVIGSVHFLADKAIDLGPEYYENRDIDAIFDSYFSTIEEAAATSLFDFIAHPDLVRMFRYHTSHDPSHLYRRLAKALHRYNVGFEINTNGMNKPLSDFYPDRRFLHIFNEEKVSVCVNSDAHKPSRIAQFFDEAYALVFNAGFTEMATFDNRKKTMVPISGEARAVR